MLNKSTKLFFGILAFVTLTFSESMTQNVQFTDMNGKAYDLFAVLDEGKYVYLELVDNG